MEIKDLSGFQFFNIRDLASLETSQLQEMLPLILHRYSISKQVLFAFPKNFKEDYLVFKYKVKNSTEYELFDPDPFSFCFDKEIMQEIVILINPISIGVIASKSYNVSTNEELNYFYFLLTLTLNFKGRLMKNETFYEVNRQEVDPLSPFLNLSNSLHQNFNEVFLQKLASNFHPFSLPLKEKILLPLQPNPLISVIIRFNGERGWLKESIQSAIDSTWENKEIIVVGDKQLPSKKIREQFSSKVIWVLSDKQGLSPTLNKGFEVANGDIILQLDDDDLLLSSSLEDCGNFFLAHSSIGFATGQYNLIDERSKLYTRVPNVDHQYNYPETLLRFEGNGHPKMWRKEVLSELRGANENLHYAEDYDLALRAGEIFNFGKIEKVLYQYRIHARQITNSESKLLSYYDKKKIKAQIRKESFERCFGKGKILFSF